MWRKAQDVVNNVWSLWGRGGGKYQGPRTIYKRLNKQIFVREVLLATSRSPNTWQEQEVTMPADEEMSTDPFCSAVKVAHILELPIAVSREESNEEVVESAKAKLRRILVSMIALLDYVLKMMCAGGTPATSKSIEIAKDVRYDTEKVLSVVDDGTIFDGKRFVSGFSKSAYEFVALRAMIVELDDRYPSNAADSSQESLEIHIGPSICRNVDTEMDQIEHKNPGIAQRARNLRRRKRAKDEEKESIQSASNTC